MFLVAHCVGVFVWTNQMIAIDIRSTANITVRLIINSLIN